MKNSDVYRAIIEIKEHCDKQKNCEECDLAVIDSWDDEVTCILNCCPSEWDIDVEEGEECPKEDLKLSRRADDEKE